VTISGESAGGMSSTYQMFASDRTGEKLFHGAILQSGGGSVGTVLPSNFRHRDRYNMFLASTPCAHKVGASEQLACLRGLPTQAVQAANTRSIMYLLGLKQEKSWQAPFFFPWTPVIDGDFISESPYELVKQGKYADVPLLVGNILDEGTLFTPTDLHNETVLLPWMRRSVLAAEGVALDEKDHVMHKVLAAYPDDHRVGSPYGRENAERLYGEENQYHRAASMREFRGVSVRGCAADTSAVGDMIFVAPTRHLLNSHAKHHRKTKTFPIWSWILAEAGPGDDPAVGVPHAADLDYREWPRRHRASLVLTLAPSCSLHVSAASQALGACL
jgi:carboxylesterase type B